MAWRDGVEVEVAVGVCGEGLERWQGGGRFSLGVFEEG